MQGTDCPLWEGIHIMILDPAFRGRILTMLDLAWMVVIFSLLRDLHFPEIRHGQAYFRGASQPKRAEPLRWHHREAMLGD